MEKVKEQKPAVVSHSGPVGLYKDKARVLEKHYNFVFKIVSIERPNIKNKNNKNNKIQQIGS